ncbi:F-actin-capping protein subunit alpha [Frankliniella fusca]|uniref:F-actin-capping protein subunit alpha n=1 Tax=Frankliniella fusca TaxID=407009 RepID=A0AAE1HRX1_9NEOP|nr:F-actin-capping protein subunit alpha [Frankliniella fusca]
MKRSACEASLENGTPVKKLRGPRGPYFKWLKAGSKPRTTEISRNTLQQGKRQPTTKKTCVQRPKICRSLTRHKENQAPHSSNADGIVNAYSFDNHDDKDSVGHLVAENRPEHVVEVEQLVEHISRSVEEEPHLEQVNDRFDETNFCVLETSSHEEPPPITTADLMQALEAPSYPTCSNFVVTHDNEYEYGELDDLEERTDPGTVVYNEQEINVSAFETDSESDDDEEKLLAVAPDLHLTVEQKIDLLLLLATKKRHNLTFSASEDIMELAGILSSDKTFFSSRYFMKRVIEKYSSVSMTEYQVCPQCGKYLGLVESDGKCDRCQNEFSTESNKKSGHMFLYLSLCDQIKSVVKHCYDDLLLDSQTRQKINRFNYEDIYDGKVYKNSVESNVLTMNCFVDGLQVSSTSKRSAWPVLLCINELPLHLRRKYILMSRLWLGLKKPNCQEYLKPFIEECNFLFRNGITVFTGGRSVHFLVKILMCISDTVARPLLRNSIQFNGEYGCGLCYHPGIVVKYGKGTVRSYSIKNGQYNSRTHEETMNFAAVAENERSSKMGIKGKSIFSEIEGFNVVSGLDLDFFHVLVNVAKRFTSLWFTDQFSGRPFNIKSKFEEVDSRLLLITPTSDVARAPRSLKDRSDYRGHEWFHWVVQYSIPVLKNILPARFLNHWGRLVHSVAVLMQNSVSKTDVAYCSRYLKSFVEEIDILYGTEHVTISIHLLTHLEESIYNYGQPWTHSAFMFESFNHDIKNFVKSSNGMAKQVCKGMQLRVALKNLEDEVSDSMSESHKEYLKKMTLSGFRNQVQHHFVEGNISFLGKPMSLILSPSYLEPLQQEGLDCRNLFIYERCLFQGEVYQCSNYQRISKQNNSVVLLDNDDVFRIDYFVVSSGKCYMLGKILPKNTLTKLCDIILPHIFVLKEPGRHFKCYPVSFINCKLLAFKFNISESDCPTFACINVLQKEMLR